MNDWSWILVALYAADLVLDAVVGLTNVARSTLPLPAELEGVYDEAKVRESQAYLSTTTRFGLIARTVQLAIMAAFAFAGGFGYIDQLAHQWAVSPIWQGLAFFGVLGTLRELLQLPFGIYSTFVIEAKFGFNRTSAKTFVGDLVKGTLLSVALGGPILAGVLEFFHAFGQSGWIWAWLGFTAITLVLSFVAPVWILPLFNKFTALPEGELKTAIAGYAEAQKFTLAGVFVMDGSLRSAKSNAFFTGFGKFRRLVLFDTIIEKQTPDEIVAVVAHEVGHFKCKHIPQTMGLSLLVTGLLFFLLSRAIGSESAAQALGMSSASLHASLIFVMLAYSPVSRLLSILTNGLSRKFEFEADAYSRKTYGKPEALISALKKLSRDNLSNPNPHPLKVLLDYTHPPVTDRVRAIRAGTG